MRKVLRGSASNIIRLVLSVLIAAVLPPFLVHHLSKAEYSAWVIILQLSTYVNLLDLGLQTVVAKLTAENYPTGNRTANRLVLSTSVSMLSAAALLGAVLVGIMVFRVPELFQQMPRNLLHDVRFSLLAIGLSSAFLLPFSPFISAFSGLQEYGFPTALSLVSRLLSAVALVFLLSHHNSLLQLAFALALVNVLTALAQFAGWRLYVRSRIKFSFFLLHRETAIHLAKSGGVLAIWSVAGLFISGLDSVIVGHFDFANTGFYGIGASATNFLLMVLTSLFAPLLPAVSSMQTGNPPEQIGTLAIRASRYCTLVLCLLGLPLLIGSYPLLSLWVGHSYALQSVAFLHLLLLANSVRQIGYPYSLIVIATGKQYLATASGIAEAITNVIVSVWLAQKIGAFGVAIGTLVGAFVGLGVHLLVSMRLTRQTIAFTRGDFLLHSVFRPLTCAIPSLVLLPWWNRRAMLPASPTALCFWIGSTILLAWRVGLNASERSKIKDRLFRLFRPKARLQRESW